MTSHAAIWNDLVMYSAWALMPPPPMFRICPFLIDRDSTNASPLKQGGIPAGDAGSQTTKPGRAAATSARAIGSAVSTSASRAGNRPG